MAEPEQHLVGPGSVARPPTNAATAAARAMRWGRRPMPWPTRIF